MSTAPIDGGGSGGGIHCILFHMSNAHIRNNSVGVTDDTRSTPPNTAHVTPQANSTANTNTWIHSFHRLDRLFSGSILILFYRLIDISLLFISLLSTRSTCARSQYLAVTSISLLIFCFMDLILILWLFLRNVSPGYSQLNEEQKLDLFRRASNLRKFFVVFKLVPVCAGTVYSFSTYFGESSGCELMRFCLGIVCMSSWLLILIPPTKPELPVRRSFALECFVLLFVLTINCTYIGTVATAVRDTDQSACEYHNTLADLYLGSPLKAYANVGIILFACTTLIHVMNLLVNQLCLRSNSRGRRLYLYCYAVQYVLNYFGAIVVIYYFSIGAMYLFQPRSGQPCRADAPDLYRTLLIWEWIRILSPLIAVSLLIIFCCLGFCFGIILSCCLPASIAVPLLESMRVSHSMVVLFSISNTVSFKVWTSFTSLSIHRSPPVSREHIDTLPTILLGQEDDRFNQTEWSVWSTQLFRTMRSSSSRSSAICRASFESNEPLKKLPCGHLFHVECVSHWLRITRICPNCRERTFQTNM